METRDRDSTSTVAAVAGGSASVRTAEQPAPTVRSTKRCDREKAEFCTAIAAARTNSTAVAEKFSSMIKTVAGRCGEELQRVDVGCVKVKTSDDICGICGVVIILEVNGDASLGRPQKPHGHVAEP